MTDATSWWSTDLTRIAPGEIDLRGYPVEQLIGRVSFVETAWLLLRGELPSRQQAELLEAALVAAVDHGPQAPSIAAARMAATCGVGLNNAVATGVNLLGDVHGGAGQQCMELLTEVRRRELSGQPLETVVADVLERQRYLPGFGHRFHPRDPRRDPLLERVESAVSEAVVDGHYLRAVTAIEQGLAERRSRPVPMNIDGATAVVFAELGFTPELGRGLFVLSRSVGVLAHSWEQRCSGERIKGPLPREMLAEYTGPSRRDVPPR